MKKTVRRFETVPLEEVLKKATEVTGHIRAEKTAKKDGPYSDLDIASTNTPREPK